MTVESALRVPLDRFQGEQPFQTASCGRRPRHVVQSGLRVIGASVKSAPSAEPGSVTAQPVVVTGLWPCAIPDPWLLAEWESRGDEKGGRAGHVASAGRDRGGARISGTA